MPKKVRDYDDELDPSIIRFTHASIRPFFSCGRRVTDTFQEIKDGKIAASSLPRILVYRLGDEYFSENNRRLWVFKQCRADNLVTLVPVRVRILEDTLKMRSRYTAERCKLQAKFMREAPATRATGQAPNAQPEEEVHGSDDEEEGDR